MVERDGRPTYDLDGIAAAFARGARLLVHVNPHNPLGRVFDVEEQLALADVVDAAGARVFADEIHAPLVHPGRRAPALRLAVAGDGPAHRHGDVDVQGLERARAQGGPADPVQRRGRRALGAGRRSCTAHGASTPGRAGRHRRLRRGRGLAGRRPGATSTATGGCSPSCSPSGCRRSGTRRRRAPTWPGWTAGGSASRVRPGAFFLERAGVALVDGPECGAPGRGPRAAQLRHPAAGADDDRGPDGRRPCGAR